MDLLKIIARFNEVPEQGKFQSRNKTDNVSKDAKSTCFLIYSFI